VLSTDVLYLFVITLRDGKHKEKSRIYGLKENVTLLAILFNMQQNQAADPKLWQT